MKKIVLVVGLFLGFVASSLAQGGQDGIIISGEGSFVTVEGDSGTMIIVGEYDSTSADPYVPVTPSRRELTTSYTVETVPNPKEQNNTYVSDPDHYLSVETVSKINVLLSALEQKTTDQVALVVLHSIGDDVPKNFATALFNKWGIGIRGKDNGLLILMVMDQRRVEFETGYGMESMLPDAICKRIQQKHMVPFFKMEQYDQGLLEGVKATTELLSNPENSKIAAELREEEKKASEEERMAILVAVGAFYLMSILMVFASLRKNHRFREHYNKEHTVYYSKISQKRWLALYVLLPLLYSSGMYFFYAGDSFVSAYLIGIYLYALIMVLEKRIRLNRGLSKTTEGMDYYDQYVQYKKSHKHWWVALLFFPFLFLFYFVYVGIKKRTLRNHPRNCKACAGPFVKLNEKDDDEHLKKTQLLEEDLKSVDYDVWLCTHCGEKEIYSYVNSFSRYSKCKSCGVQAAYLFSNRTVVSATYSSTGEGCKTYKCKNCSAVHEERYTIPVKQRSSSSGSGGSSGGSFGGGSSGGGGSGSSW